MPIVQGSSGYGLSAYSRASNWENLDDPGSPILIESIRSFRIGREPNVYEVIIAAPGRYRLRGSFSRVGVGMLTSTGWDR